MIGPWTLPPTWAWSNAGEIADVVGGGTPSTAQASNFGGDVPWVTPADMSGHRGKYIAGGVRTLTLTGLASSGARWLPAGTVLFSSRAPIGYCAIAARPLATNQGFKSLVPRAGLRSDFLLYWLRSAKSMAEGLASGTTFLELSGAKAATLAIPVAPEAEQARVVEALEALLEGLDEAVAELFAARRKLALYRQSLLKSAVEGTLTTQWRRQTPPQETGTELLVRIQRERRARWESQQTKKFKSQGKAPPKDWCLAYREPEAPAAKALCNLPPAWTWASLEQVASDEAYSLSIGPFGSNLKVDDYAESGVPLVFVRNIRSRRYGGEYTRYVTEAKSRELAAHAIAAGDVLVTKMGEPPGDADVYPKDQPTAIITADCIKVRCQEGLVAPAFLAAAMLARARFIL